MCACLTLRRAKMDSATLCLKELHWLPIRQCVEFKILTLAYKSLHGSSPQYIRDLLHFQTVRCEGLRSESDTNLRLRPTTKYKTFADRSFSVATLELRNRLPVCIRNSNTLLKFKSRLKIHLFSEYFGSTSNICSIW